MLIRHDDVELRTAHDVRNLRLCASCGGMGDRRKMLSLKTRGLDGLHHGACVVQRLTAAQVLALPEDERSKLTLGATGPKLMSQLLDLAGGQPALTLVHSQDAATSSTARK